MTLSFPGVYLGMQQVEKPGEGGEAQWCEHCGKGGNEADGLVIPGVYLGK